MIAALLVLALWCGLRVQRELRRGRGRTRLTAAAVYAAYVLHLGLIAGFAIYPGGRLALPETPSLVIGAALALVGVFLFVAGVFSFRSFKRVSGMDTSKLVTSGVYRWSRNPQNLGWSLLSSGVALMGRSWPAMLLALGFCLLFHLYVASEEAFLERLFGRDYREYRRRSHRYFGPPAPRDEGEPAASAVSESEEFRSRRGEERMRQGDVV